MMNNQDKEFDIVLYGATSFVGRLTADYLQQFMSKQNTEGKAVSWAIAGRNSKKLDKVKADIGNDSLQTIIADSENIESLQDMAARAKVIISTVGPYMKYGEPLIKACTEQGTDYVDLTGEALFIKQMMDKYQEAAEKSGARIVNSCGFDSIPSDLGVLFTQKYAEEKLGGPCDTIHMRVKAAKGGLSGGTFASMATILEEVGTNKSVRKLVANPYVLNDDLKRPNVRQSSIKVPEWDEENNRWLAPFIMESINTRIVHRSNQLRGYEYGRDFKYDEALWMPAGLKGRVFSYGLVAGMAGFATGMMFKPTRDLINDKILPQSGDGPSKEERDNGYFDVRFIGKRGDGQQVKTKVTSDKDPGYGSTCQMLSQSALCLVQDISKQKVKGGFWTPASAMGEALLERLQQHAGLKFEKIEG